MPHTLARLTSQSLALVCLGVSTLGCTADDPSAADTCVEVESRDYARLEDGAARTLGGIDHTLHRYSQCEDTGQPRAVVIADVEAWRSRRQVNRYLSRLRWMKNPGSVTFTSPDGRLTAHPVIAKEPSRPLYVAIYFSEAA